MAVKIVNINKAEVKDLMLIPGVGKVRAQLIIKQRPFRDMYELSKVAGLGEKRMKKLIEQENVIITIKK